MSSIFPPELLHHYINGPMRKYFNIKLWCADESTHSCCEARLGNPITRTVMQRSSIASPSQTEIKCGDSALQIQIILRCVKALSLLQFLRTCLMASFKPDCPCLLISQS
ncbi:hypothetical protein glysoja_034551 [Glycine soja]|uniref:Uncharacterized protein n=1 Tax=Glycine soja TaxID=3848 RepID=A0A0B2SN28_GLYSO|nr:hypothetical protein glysoja_034551 [Glycine soja]